MNGKSWISAVAVAVIYFLLGGLFYGWLMKDWFASQAANPNMAEPNLVIIALLCLTYGLLMAYTFPFGYKGGSLVKEGLRFGILFSLIVNLPSGLGMVAMGAWTWAGFFVATIWEIIVGAILGIILAKMTGNAARAAA